MSTPEESLQQNSIYFYISFDSITQAVCSVLPQISFCRGPVNTDLKGFPRQLCPFCRLQIEAHVRVNAGGGVKMGCLDGGTLINLKQAHQHADVDTSNDVWIRYSIYTGRFQCKLWLHRMTGVCLPPRTERERQTQWAHDVVATLNQRQWRWFNVATTSCDTRRENAVFTQILYIETLTPTKLLPLQIWYRLEVSGMDNGRQPSTECYTLTLQLLTHCYEVSNPISYPMKYLKNSFFRPKVTLISAFKSRFGLFINAQSCIVKSLLWSFILCPHKVFKALQIKLWGFTILTSIYVCISISNVIHKITPGPNKQIPDFKIMLAELGPSLLSIVVVELTDWLDVLFLLCSAFPWSMVSLCAGYMFIYSWMTIRLDLHSRGQTAACGLWYLYYLRFLTCSTMSLTVIKEKGIIQDYNPYNAELFLYKPWRLRGSFN